MNASNVKTPGEIRAEARRALGTDGQYLRYVAAYLLLTLVMIAISIPLMMVLGAGIGASGIAPFFAPGGQPEIGLFLDPGVMGPLLASVLAFVLLAVYPLGFCMWGQAAMAIAAMRRGLTAGHALSGWGHGWRMGWIATVKITYLHLWSLLLVVPGLVKFCSYAMTEFVAVDHPDWNAARCITESRRLMDGHKLRYFLMLLGFAGWVLLATAASALPLVGNFAQWLLMPYIETAKAAFYENLLDCGESGQGFPEP